MVEKKNRMVIDGRQKDMKMSELSYYAKYSPAVKGYVVYWLSDKNI